MSADEQVLPARSGVALRLDTGDRLRVVNTHGSQVVDLWAMAAEDVLESMSMPHSRNPWFRLAPRPGDVLVTNLRRPILRLLEDSSPGVHDTLIPSCDSERYRQLGAPADHGSCTDNFHAALRAIGVDPPRAVPNAVNLWMNVIFQSNGTISIAAPVSKPGDHVLLEAEIDCTVALSACPHDLPPVQLNGIDCTPHDVAYAVIRNR
ncbi:MAG TPA: urea carboxylase-associated family protein [Ilumatobacteraceae bacterium]